MKTENLENSINELSEKLQSIGIEIYQLNNSICVLANQLKIIVDKIRENE